MGIAVVRLADQVCVVFVFGYCICHLSCGYGQISNRSNLRKDLFWLAFELQYIIMEKAWWWEEVLGYGDRLGCGERVFRQCWEEF